MPSNLFSQPCLFVAGAAEEAAVPPPSWPEVAFSGRSNVGKSSLLNALVNRKNLARVSQEPGRTRQINFFLLGGSDEPRRRNSVSPSSPHLLLADLPGYGYAKASRKEAKNWTELTRRYIRGRSTLRRVCVLMDARREATKDDEAWMELLDEAAVAFEIVLTKADAVKPIELAARIATAEKLAASHPAALRAVIATSSAKGTGIDTLRQTLAELC